MPAAPAPTRTFFDPYNSSSTGHQRAENRLSGSTSWRASRSHKLTQQLRDGTGGGGDKHVADLVGAGSEHFGRDGRKENGDWERGAPGLREHGWQDIRGMMRGQRKRVDDDEGPVVKKSKPKSERSASVSTSGSTSGVETRETTQEPPWSPRPSKQPDSKEDSNSNSSAPNSPSQIFRSLNIYLNGSTAPLVSDHRLKHLVAQHGGTTSIALGRRSVTHVIVGHDGGTGLASGKIHKEVALVRGAGIKYVTAQWVLDSIERGVRQPEARYVPKSLGGRIGGSGQASVRDLFRPRSK